MAFALQLAQTNLKWSSMIDSMEQDTKAWLVLAEEILVRAIARGRYPYLAESEEKTMGWISTA
jgi:hypothetical protein